MSLVLVMQFSDRVGLLLAVILYEQYKTAIITLL